MSHSKTPLFTQSQLHLIIFWGQPSPIKYLLDIAVRLQEVTLRFHVSKARARQSRDVRWAVLERCVARKAGCPPASFGVHHRVGAYEGKNLKTIRLWTPGMNADLQSSASPLQASAQFCGPWELEAVRAQPCVVCFQPSRRQFNPEGRNSSVCKLLP